MQEFNVKRYQSTDNKEWDTFVRKNIHVSFLFRRDFMEYHKDRFVDFSLMVYNAHELVGICPFHIINEEVFSHQGLTYGGLLFDVNFSVLKIKNAIASIFTFLKKFNIEYLNIKNLPSFYGNPHSDKLVEVFRNSEAQVYKSLRVLAIDYSEPFNIHKTKLKNFRKNTAKGFIIEETSDFSIFWNKVLIPRLYQKHNVKPVHTLDEIKLLNSKFPEQIKQFNIALDDEILAGITIFDKGNVVRSQYGATSKRGEKERALEYLFLHLIYKYKEEGKQFFSMGTVTDNNELGYNPGLLKQKEELGCSTYLQDFYRLKL